MICLQMKEVSGVNIDRWVVHKAQHSSGLSIFSTIAKFPLYTHLYEFPEEKERARRESMVSVCVRPAVRASCIHAMRCTRDVLVHIARLLACRLYHLVHT